MSTSLRTYNAFYSKMNVIVVISLLNRNLRLYLLFWAGKIGYVFWAVMTILVNGMTNWIEFDGLNF